MDGYFHVLAEQHSQKDGDRADTSLRGSETPWKLLGLRSGLGQSNTGDALSMSDHWDDGHDSSTLLFDNRPKCALTARKRVLGRKRGILVSVACSELSQCFYGKGHGRRVRR